MGRGRLVDDVGEACALFPEDEGLANEFVAGSAAEVLVVVLMVDDGLNDILTGVEFVVDWEIDDPAGVLEEIGDPLVALNIVTKTWPSELS